MKKLSRQKLQDLESKLKHLQRVHIDTSDDRVKQEMKEIRREIDEIRTQISQ